MNLKKALRAIGAIVMDEVDRNPDFAQRLRQALTTSISASTTVKTDAATPLKKNNRSREPAVLDPTATLADHGDHALRLALQDLPIEQLLDIVAEFAMDPSKLVMKWKSSERIIEHIVDSAKRRSVKGDAFRL
jgi:hypothetical protein